jgi:ribonuclease Y
MDHFSIIATTAVSGLLGMLAGYLIHVVITLRIQSKAEEEARSIKKTAREHADILINKARLREEEYAQKWQTADERLERKEEMFTAREERIEIERSKLAREKEELNRARTEIETKESSLLHKLENIAGLTQKQAREEIFTSLRKNSEEDFRIRAFKLEREGQEKLQEKAKSILVSIIQRIANTETGDILTSHLPIESDDVKGKIIGKDGRNIKTLERTLGVDILVDETPGALTISSFDPLRRATARLALEELIADGRIQPARIEEIVLKTQERVAHIIKERGEWACMETGTLDLDPKLVTIIGRLWFRTSFGQNVLQHSVEMAHLAGMLAAELGGDIRTAKAGALLHDIGKAIDHEVDGTHVDIGRRLLKKFNIDESIISAMQSHHEEYPYETLESIIVQTVDALSGGRPGARKESSEQYLKRLGDLESIAKNHDGVKNAYAISAGRELRIFVESIKVDDLAAYEIARETAKEIEKQLRYPGEIKVSVIRETRCITFAR